jgi:putative SOS response-associated peptidase YedK
MCNRYSLITNPADLARRFGVDDALFRILNFGPRYNLAPTEGAVTVVEENEQRQPRVMRFGLIPRWAKDARIAVQCLNARSETVAEKPAFRDNLKNRRCLVLADGFYEWKSDGKQKRPLRVVRADRQPFAFAGLWDRWRNPAGDDVETFTIVTTEANDLIRPFHDRMPVILKPEDEPVWLAPYVTENRTLLPLLKPLAPEELAVYEVDPYVNKAGNEGPRCVEPVSHPELF